jgi:uncharacterized protein involved in exopolysaccharide biosynthesis
MRAFVCCCDEASTEIVLSVDWDMPGGNRPARASGRAVPTPARPQPRHRNAPDWSNGLFDPLVLLGWLARNFIKIGIIATILTIVGVAAFLSMSFPYRATAIVLADPRDQRITLQEEVLPSIGTDAAVLESMVQIVKSDGFLLGVMRDLGLLGNGQTAVSREDEMKALGRFRKSISVERKGATYLVEISYSAGSGEEAARIANGIAEAFAASQNQSRADATEGAARSLSGQLVEIRARLNESEEAVAKFRADHGIVYVDERNTVQMRQLADLNQQLALVNNATEDARARYEENRNGGALTRPGQASDGEGAQLSFLRQQRAQLMQARDQQLQIYGARHPRLVQTQQTLDGIDREIVRERGLLADQLKAELDVAVSKQGQLERQIQELSSAVIVTDAARVQLEALEREATANRELYQQLLSRNKATDQLALLTSDNFRLVSAAVAPIASSRPSLTLLLPVIGFLSLVAATVYVIVANGGGLLKSAAPRQRIRRPRVRPSTPIPGPSVAATPPPPPTPSVPPVYGSLLNANRRPATAGNAIYREPRAAQYRNETSYDPQRTRR